VELFSANGGVFKESLAGFVNHLEISFATIQRGSEGRKGFSQMTLIFPQISSLM
jgi:hypothetical protein